MGFTLSNNVYHNESSIFKYELSYPYGITPKIESLVLEKNKAQLEYLQNTFLCDNGTPLNMSLYQMTNTAMMTPKKYCGEIWQRVQSLQKYADYLGFSCPLFLTITPKTYFKPTKQIFLTKKGNVSHYKLVDNKNFMAFHDGSLDYVQQSINYISGVWRSFLGNERVVKDIKKEYGERPIFMRTYEPHVDGTPHAHLVIFIPPAYRDRFVEVAQSYFNESRFDIKFDFDEGKGGVVAYILKYILKSFKNAKDGKIDKIACWYSYYKIRRFTTSRTLIPLSVFRKINAKKEFQNLLNATFMYKKNQIFVNRAYHPLTAMYFDITTLQSSDYKIFQVCFNTSEIGISYDVLYQKNFNLSTIKLREIRIKESFEKSVLKRIKPYKPLFVEIEGNKFIYRNNKLYNVAFDVNSFSRMELYHYFKTLNADTCDSLHYGFIKNKLIDYGLIFSEKIPLDLYREDFSYFERENPFKDSMRKALFYVHCSSFDFVPSSPYLKDKFIKGL